jgi:DNA-directed RNA polymerase subunit N (RpoN/RPB10)
VELLDGAYCCHRILLRWQGKSLHANKKERDDMAKPKKLASRSLQEMLYIVQYEQANAGLLMLDVYNNACKLVDAERAFAKELGLAKVCAKRVAYHAAITELRNSVNKMRANKFMKGA